MEMKRRTLLLRIAAVVTAALAIRGLFRCRQRFPRPTEEDGGERQGSRFPGRVVPLDESSARTAGRWIG